jgi:hypothetical protein
MMFTMVVLGVLLAETSFRTQVRLLKADLCSRVYDVFRCIQVLASGIAVSGPSSSQTYTTSNNPHALFDF